MSSFEQCEWKPAQRREQLLQLLQRHKSLDVKEAAAMLHVHEATVRRDLNHLAAQGLAQRTHGGAVLVEGMDAEIPLFARETANLDKKDAICREAAALVRDGDTLFLDSSSTTARMIRYLRSKKDLKIITNGAKTAILLSQLPGIVLYCAGGRMRENSLSYVGAETVRFLENFYADAAFFSCRGLSERGLSDCCEEEAVLRRTMIAQSRLSVLLMDSTKVGTDSFFHICKADAVGRILCDQPIAF